MMLAGLLTLIFTIFVNSAQITPFEATPQVPIHKLDNFCPDPGYRAPFGCEWRDVGTYHIINYSFQYAATINDSVHDAAVVSLPVETENAAQHWGIFALDNAHTVFMIYNHATGAALYAAENRKVTRARYVPPYDKRAQWSMDRETFADVEGGPVIFTNRAFQAVLDLSNSEERAGTPILVHPRNPPITRNQAWYLSLAKLD